MFFRFSASFCAGVLLAACGGGSSGVTLPVLLDRTDSFIGDNGSFNEIERLTTRADVAGMGSASYSGVAIFAREDAIDPDTFDFVALGSATARADFAAGTLEGEAGNFYDLETAQNFSEFEEATGTKVAGALTFNLADTNESDFFFAGTVSGSVTRSTGEVVQLDADIMGGIAEEDAQYLVLEGVSLTDRVGVAVFAERN